MTLEQATDIWVRLETAILSLEAALPIAKGDRTGMAPESDIVIALQYARAALKVWKESTLRDRGQTGGDSCEPQKS